MTRHRHIIAVAFCVAGWVLGVPSLLLLLAMGGDLITLHFRPAPDKFHPLAVGTYGLVGLLVNSAHIFGNLFEGATIAATWLLDIAAIITLIVIGFAVILYLIGKGIQNRATWARIVAMLMSVSLVFISLGLMTILPHNLILVPLLAIGAALYTIWTLGWKYS